MTGQHIVASAARRPLRLWPGVVAAVLVCLIRFVAPLIFPEVGAIAIIGGVFGALAIVVWWLFFSRAVWPERLGALALMILAPMLVLRVAHESIATGMMGMMLPLYSVPVMTVALVAWAVTTCHMSNGIRRSALVVGILLACGAFALLRTGGVLGAGSEIHWRWTPTPEERLLSQANDEPAPLPPPATTEAQAPRHRAQCRSLRPLMTLTSLRRVCRLLHRQPLWQPTMRSGPAFADLIATAAFTACESKQTGLVHRPSRYGVVRSVRAGPRSRSAAI